VGRYWQQMVEPPPGEAEPLVVTLLTEQAAGEGTLTRMPPLPGATNVQLLSSALELHVVTSQLPHPPSVMQRAVLLHLSEAENVDSTTLLAQVPSFVTVVLQVQLRESMTDEYQVPCAFAAYPDGQLAPAVGMRTHAVFPAGGLAAQTCPPGHPVDTLDTAQKFLETS